MTRDIVVNLERAVSIPGEDHDPPQTNEFRATEESRRDATTWFFGLNIGPEHAAVRISNDNIRSVAYLNKSTPTEG